MLGHKIRDFKPLTAVSLDDLVHEEYFYRQVDRCLDLSYVRSLVSKLYSIMGRPSIDPIVFFKLQLIAFFVGIRSERQLDVAVAPDGRIGAIANSENITVFTPGLESVLFLPAAVSSVSGDSELDSDIEIDGRGNLYVLGFFNNAVFKYSPDGRFITRFGSQGMQKASSEPPAIWRSTGMAACWSPISTAYRSSMPPDASWTGSTSRDLSSE